MATIKAGTYRFNDVLTDTAVELSADVNFTVAVSAYGMYEGTAHCDNITVNADYVDDTGSELANTMRFNVLELDPAFEYLQTPVQLLMYQTAIWDRETIGGIWETDSYSEGIKTITIPKDTEVSAEFAEWFGANAVEVVEETPAATITHNGEEIASLFPGQTATLKCAGMKMAGDVVVSVADNVGGGGDANIVPLTVTENGVYDTYYETGTEVWDSNTEYAGSVTVDGVTLSFKKAEHLIVPDDLSALKSSQYSVGYEWLVDGETSVFSSELSPSLHLTSGVVATLIDYTVLWVKNAAPLNAQFGISFLEDNTVYITNYLQMLVAAQAGATYCKVSVTAPSKKVENVAFRPVTVALPISKDTLVRSVKAGYEIQFSTSEYYKYFRIKGPEVQQLTVTPSAVEQTFTADEDKCFKKVTVGAVDLSNLSSMHILCGIYMKTLPQTQYVVGGSLNTIGGVFVAQYTDGSTQEIELTNKVVSGFGAVMNTPGNHMLTVKYAENGINSWATYPITITEG